MNYRPPFNFRSSGLSELRFELKAICCVHEFLLPHLGDQQLDRLLAAVIAEQKPRCRKLAASDQSSSKGKVNHATQNVAATFAFVQKLSQAKNFQDVVKIQTEFMARQMNSFNEQARILSEVYSKAAQDAVKTPFRGA